MSRLIQTMPEPADPYRGDPLLDAWPHRHGVAAPAATAAVTAVAREVVTSLRQAHQAESQPPVLVRYSPWGSASTGLTPRRAGRCSGRRPSATAW